MIIGITGKAGSGKSAVAKALVERCGFAEISFADPLKRICADVFGWDCERLYGPSERRNEPDPVWDGLTARRALQQIGTECFRALHPDVWARMAIKTAIQLLEDQHDFGGPYNGYPGVVIPDVRFDNEAAAIRGAGGKVVKLIRPGAGLDGDAGAHSSEAGVADALSAFTIENTGTLSWLQDMSAALPEVLFK